MPRSATAMLLGALAVWAFALGCSEPKPEVEKQEAPTKRQVQQEAERLKSLGYVDWMEADNPKEEGVTVHKTDKASPGLNLYTPRHLGEAFLLDMKGEVLHKWKDADSTKDGGWQHVELMPDGSLLALNKDHSIAKYDWESKRQWSAEFEAHHDFYHASDGSIYALGRKVSPYMYKGVELPIVDDTVVFLSEDGIITQRLPLLEILKSHIPEKKFALLREAVALHKVKTPGVKLGKADTPSDVFHTNTIEVIERDVPGLCKKGAVLLSMRELNLIALVDLAKKSVLWSWGEKDLDNQHHPTLLANNNILVFDNGTKREASRVLEVDPIKNEIVWSYSKDGFFSRRSSGSQELPNRNVLVTDWAKGRAFEVTRSGEIVWEFFNPFVTEIKIPASLARATMYRFTRYPLDYVSKRTAAPG